MAPSDVSICLHAFGIAGCGSFGGVQSCTREGVWVVLGLFVLAGSMLVHRTVGMLPFLLLSCATLMVCHGLPRGSCVAYHENGILNISEYSFHPGLLGEMMVDSVQCMRSTLLCETIVVTIAVVVLLDAVSACNERGFDCVPLSYKYSVALE